MSSWVLASALAAVLFGLGDFLVVKTEQQATSLAVFLAYSIIIGLGSALILSFRKDKTKLLGKLVNDVGLKTLFSIAALHFLAYNLHFYAIQKAKNPGYANALVMFHVAVLALLSWWFLGRPLSFGGVIGVVTMFVGAFIIVKAAAGA